MTPFISTVRNTDIDKVECQKYIKWLKCQKCSYSFSLHETMREIDNWGTVSLSSAT